MYLNVNFVGLFSGIMFCTKRSYLIFIPYHLKFYCKPILLYLFYVTVSPEARPFRLYRIPLHALSGLVAPCERRCPTPSPEPPDPPSSNPDPPEKSVKLNLLTEPSRGLSRSCSSSPTPQSFISPAKWLVSNVTRPTVSFFILQLCHVHKLLYIK